MTQPKCPVTGHSRQTVSLEGNTNKKWWPNQLNLKVLHQNSHLSNPLGIGFNYAKAYSQLDLKSLKADLYKLMKDSKAWWPADYGHYGPLFIRMAWHSAGTYRMGDGRGGASDGSQRFPPLSSWPDNINLDKARRLLWPIKQKYGQSISWADLMILAGNCALESMGLKPLGFAGGRVDIWEAQADVYWGSEDQWLGDERYSSKRELEDPLAADQMGLIYVNPEGPKGVPDAALSAIDIRETFRRMAMNDEETVALIAGGHTFGKAHGAAKAIHVGPEPEAAPMAQQGLGWMSKYRSGKGQDTIGNGIEGAWKPNPTTWDMGYFDTLFKYDWNLVKSPAGAFQWTPTDPLGNLTVEDATDPNIKHPPMMTTADMALKIDPIYLKISKRFHENRPLFESAFKDAWFKLTHRDLGPVSRYLGNDIPSKVFTWQDPVPILDHDLVNKVDINALKQAIIDSDLSIASLVTTAWASASTYRGSDKRGGANGARIRFKPQSDWIVNEPKKLNKVLKRLTKIQHEFHKNQINDTRISLADLIVLGGSVGIEQALIKSGSNQIVPFIPGRMDARIEQTDIEAFKVLEPKTDAFRNYVQKNITILAEKLLIERAQLLTLTAPEMTVLIGGMRMLGTNHLDTKLGVLTKTPLTLSNDFFINLLDMDTTWHPMDDNDTLFQGKALDTGKVKWTASRVDLVFGSNAELRAIAEVYAADDAKDKFIQDFIVAWCKVMNADRFDLQ